MLSTTTTHAAKRAPKIGGLSANDQCCAVILCKQVDMDPLHRIAAYIHWRMLTFPWLPLRSSVLPEPVCTRILFRPPFCQPKMAAPLVYRGLRLMFAGVFLKLWKKSRFCLRGYASRRTHKFRPWRSMLRHVHLVMYVHLLALMPVTAENTIYIIKFWPGSNLNSSWEIQIMVSWFIYLLQILTPKIPVASFRE
jgi:hypothetical protein